MLDGVFQISVYQERLLDDGGNATSPPETEPPKTDVNDIIGGDGPQSMGIIFLAAFIVVVLFLAWRMFRIWRARRERYMLQVQSARADTVLGDMQVRLLVIFIILYPLVFQHSRNELTLLLLSFLRWFRVKMNMVMTILNYYNVYPPICIGGLF